MKVVLLCCLALFIVSQLFNHVLYMYICTIDVTSTCNVFRTLSHT